MKETHYERIHNIDYESFVRSRITELRMKRTPYVSEHKMGLELGHGGSYIRNITQNGALPSINCLFDIIDYLDVSVDEFFAPLKDTSSPYARICERLRAYDEESIAKVETFMNLIEK